jgi:hypothetical protein
MRGDMGQSLNMESDMKFLSIFLFILILSGCMNPAATGPSFSELQKPEKNKSVVYFYRPMADDGGTVCLKILLNDIEQGCLGTKGFLPVVLVANDYNIKIKPDAFPSHTLLEFNTTIKPNQDRLFRYKIDRTAPLNSVVSRYTAYGTVFIEEIPFTDALSELSGLNQSIAP